MARIDWVVAKLNNWALWVQAEASGGGGYPTQSVLLANPVDTTREIDLRGTVDNVEALLTDKAVSSLRVDHAQIHRTLVCIYIEDRGVPGTAQQISRAVPTVHANLARGDVLLSIWFNRHRESQDTLKRGYEAVQKSVQTSAQI
jgi:hypothetical protein